MTLRTFVSFAIPCVTLSLIGCSTNEAQPPAAPASIAPAAGDHPATIGDAPAPVAAPPVKKSATPIAALQDLLAARTERDLPRLARYSVGFSSSSQLTTVETARAWRNFEAPAVQPFWKKVEKAVSEGNFTVTEEKNRARIDIQTGGSLGNITLEMIQENGWKLKLQY